MLFKKSQTIGLDVGSGYIKLVRINETKTGQELSLFDFIATPHGAIVDGIIEDRSLVVQAIQELLAKNKIKDADVVTAVAGHSSVIVKRITIPKMSEEELSKSIKVEAEQYIPFDINDVNIDFQILGDSKFEAGQMDIILVAAKKNVLNDYAEALETTGLTPVVIDVCHFAVSNAFEFSYGVLDNECIALVNIGANSTNLIIVKGGYSLFTRDTPIGGNVHTEALMSDLNLTLEDAERAKRGLSVEGISPEQVNQIILNSSEEIFSDIQRSMDFFRSSISDEEITKIVLSGGLALTNGFKETLAERVLMPVELLDPFKNLAINPKLDDKFIKDMAPIGVVATGLAMRRSGDK
ncbi:MAG: pilus assembly protein PilM [Thermodesulfovibrionales bacterium]|nr:pilus assembly protein PilM [Thermodesulfovibrionales bacterium]